MKSSVSLEVATCFTPVILVSICMAAYSQPSSDLSLHVRANHSHFVKANLVCVVMGQKVNRIYENSQKLTLTQATKIEVVKCQKMQFLIQSYCLKHLLLLEATCHFLPDLHVGFDTKQKNTLTIFVLLISISHFLLLLVQSTSADDKMESSADGEERGDGEDQSKPDSDKMEEGCGRFS